MICQPDIDRAMPQRIGLHHSLLVAGGIPTCIAGVEIGLGEAILLFLAVPTLINRWLKEKVGLYIGLCMAFTGVGGVIFNPLGD